MRCGLLAGSVAILAALVFSACATSGSAVVLPADARALRYGSTAPEIFNNPELRDRLRGLFGPDWSPGPGRGYAAPEYFPPSSSIRMVRIGTQDYIAVAGCVQTGGCARYPGLLLIGPEGQLMARLDDGGFSRYYEYGPMATGGAGSRAAIDSAWAAVSTVSQG